MNGIKRSLDDQIESGKNETSSIPFTESGHGRRPNIDITDNEWDSR